MSEKLRAAAQAALETLEDVFGKNKIDVSAINNLRAALAEPAQKPMHPEIKKMYEDYFDKCFRESSAPPRREWVGLTDDEVYKIAVALEGEHWIKIADAFEAKLKEKNT